MKQRTIVYLLSFTCLLVAVHLAVSFLFNPGGDAYGDTAGTREGNYILATGTDQSGSFPLVYVFDTETQTLGSYATTPNGIKLRGVRKITWDLMLWEYKGGAKDDSVRGIKKEVEANKSNP